MKFLVFCLFSLILTMDPAQYMEKFRNDIVTPDPSSASSRQGGVNYGETRTVTYHSNYCGRDKNAIVILPAGYTESEKYPVVYVNHGVFGSVMIC